jgi:hypothetical protein
MAGNNAPIFSKVGDIQGGAILTTAMTSGATAYTGVDINCIPIFTADATNGGFVQRLRFKPYGNVNNAIATVARIFINEGTLNLASTLGAISWAATPATQTSAGSSLYAGSAVNFYAKVQAVDQWGGLGTASAETSIQLSANGNSITWSWNAVVGAKSYRLYVGPSAGGEYALFTTTSTSFTQTVPYLSASAAAAGQPQFANPADYVTNNMFYGELALPAFSTSATQPNGDLDYPMNIALPPGYRILVGLGTSPTAGSGYVVTAIGGKY